MVNPSIFPFKAEYLHARRLLNALENALNPLLHVGGSISTLNEDLIPEVTDGFTTVKRWALDVLRALDPSKDEAQGNFLTNLYKAFTLGRLRQDSHTFGDCLRRIPSATSRMQWHPRLVIGLPSGNPVYALDGFLTFISGSGHLDQGIRFFRCCSSPVPKTAPLTTW